MDPMSGCDIRLVFAYRPETVHRSTKDAYTPMNLTHQSIMKKESLLKNPVKKVYPSNKAVKFSLFDDIFINKIF